MGHFCKGSQGDHIVLETKMCCQMGTKMTIVLVTLCLALTQSAEVHRDKRDLPNDDISLVNEDDQNVDKVGTVKNYKGYWVIEITPQTTESADLLRNMELETSPDLLDFWSEPKANHTAEILVHPDMVGQIQSLLANEKITYN